MCSMKRNIEGINVQNNLLCVLIIHAVVKTRADSTNKLTGIERKGMFESKRVKIR